MKTTSVTVLLVIVLALLTVSTAQAEDNPQAQFERAREALNRGKFEDAASRFAEVFQKAQQAELAGDALYWEAFARYRLGKTHELKQAAKLLALQARQYSQVATAGEGQSLASRVYAELAERGEADAAREITERASEEDMRQETRMAALQALMQMDPRKARPMLKKIILDDKPENRELRQHAIMIMCQQDDKESEDLLIGLLDSEKDPEMLAHVVMCLSMSNSDRALKALMKVFKETNDPDVSEAVLMSVAQHGGPAVFDFLADIATDQKRDTDTRAQAMMALGMTDSDPRVTDILVKVLETEKDREILEMALFSLAQSDDPAAREAIKGMLKNTWGGQDEEFQAMVLHFAVQNGDVDLKALREMYKQANSRDLKQQICHVLTMVEDQEAALDLLIDITRTETDPEIKRDAVFWIGQFDSERAANYLLDVINEK
jgi:tetratricopeptide (TPR) repeat protein|nr:HEAT repeat domain-containing protein [Candidatus Krumholzibacteria bacterium]